MKDLKEYQRKAIDKIRKRFDIYIEEEGNEIVFKAPTGSGKTYIITKFLEELCTDIKYNEQKIAFIWASIGKGDLHKQSYKSVKSELNGFPSCELLDPAYVRSHAYIEDKQILFVNWEKLVQKNSKDGTWKNSLMKDQEGRNFIDLIESTKENDTKICLIVDESHIGEYKDTSISSFRDDVLKPTLTIEMSATPKEKPNVEVKLDDAIDEGMIKESLIVNQGIGSEIDEDVDSIQLVLSKAEEQRKLIVENYAKVGADVNPLVLVQVPNTDLGDDAIRIVEDYLSTQGINYDNGLLVKWLSGESKNFDSEKMKRNNNEISYMIFKTVVDTGWDCPRAHILVKLRDVKSNTSKIQTIGRILRTPEAKKYNNQILDNGYIFTNMEYIDPRNDEYSENRIKDLKATIKEDKKDGLPSILSFYKSRAGAYNAADSRIDDIIEQIFCEYIGIGSNDVFADDILREKGFNIDDLDKISMMQETDIAVKSMLDEERIENKTAGNVEARSSEVEIEGKVYEIIGQNLNGLAPARSIKPIITGIKKTITYHLNIPRDVAYTYTLKLIAKNESRLADIVSKSTNKFKEVYPDVKRIGKYSPYEFQNELRYSSVTYKEIMCELSLYDHMYVINSGTSKLENDFLAELDEKYKNKIDWIWHNGSEPNVINFGIENEEKNSIFRPDYLIKFKDGRFGIFDTKSAQEQFEDTPSKAESLYKYIHTDEDQGKNIFGGIIVEHNKQFYLTQSEIFHTYDEDPNEYTNIALIF